MKYPFRLLLELDDPEQDPKILHNKLKEISNALQLPVSFKHGRYLYVVEPSRPKPTVIEIDQTVERRLPNRCE